MGLLNLGAGLAEAGKNIATTAGAWTLEAQRAEEEQKKIALIDELTGKREEKGRAFTTSERVATQQHTSGENALTRTNAKDIANITAEAHVKSAGISAGGAIESARIHAGSVEKQIASAEKLASVFQPGEDGTMLMVNKVDGKVTPLLGEDGQPQKFRDPDLAKTQLEAVRTTSVQLGDLQRKYQTDVAPAHALLRSIESDKMLFGPEKDAAIAKQRAVIDDIEKRYEPDFNRLNSRLDGLAESLGTKAKVGGASATARPPLASFAKPAVPVTGARGLLGGPQ